MVGSLTVGKKKYADVEDEMYELKAKCDQLQKDFLRLIERDAEVFEPLSKAYGMPKETEEEKAEKARVMEIVLKDACSVPMEIKMCIRDSPKVAEALQGRNVLILSEKEENYKAIGAAAGLAYDQIVGAESAVDINLAKQLNVVTTQLGVNAQKIVMNIGSAAAGYGYEYVVSTMRCV